MTTFLLIRHGLTDAVGHTITGRLPGIHLNEEGRRQAEQLGERLEKLRIEAIWSSPLERAMETAGPVSRRLGLPVNQSTALTEVDFGQWSGLSLEQLQKSDDWATFNSFRSSTRAPEGELMTEVQSRMIAEMNRLRVQNEARTVALFSHADTIKAALLHYLGMPIDHLHRLEIGPASISEVRLHVRGMQVWGINR